MRKIINSTYITLDGVIENPQDWPYGGADDGAGAIQTELLLACDALLMGRRTYEGFAPVWPTRSGDPYSDRINSRAKYVVSSTLRDLPRGEDGPRRHQDAHLGHRHPDLPPGRRGRVTRKVSSARRRVGAGPAGLQSARGNHG
jgi:hypothetical protein